MLPEGALGFPYRYESLLSPYVFPQLIRLVYRGFVANQLGRATNFRCTFRSPFMDSFAAYLNSARRRLCELSLPSHPLRRSSMFRKIATKYEAGMRPYGNLDRVPSAQNIAPGLFYCPMSEDMWYYQFLLHPTTSSSLHPSPKKETNGGSPDFRRRESQTGSGTSSQTSNEDANIQPDLPKPRVRGEVPPIGRRVDGFYVSPVCEAWGGLWQWRAVWCARSPNVEPIAAPHDCCPSPSTPAVGSASAGEKSLNFTGRNAHDTLLEEEIEKEAVKGVNQEAEGGSDRPQPPKRPRWGSGGYHMLPFLIFPSSGGLSSGPPLHLNHAVVSHLLSTTTGQGSRKRYQGEELVREGRPGEEGAEDGVFITIPSLIGNIIVIPGERNPPCVARQPRLRSHHPTPFSSKNTDFGKPFYQTFVPQRQRVVDNIFNLLIPADSQWGRSDASALSGASSQTLSPKHGNGHGIQRPATTSSIFKDITTPINPLEGDYTHASSTPRVSCSKHMLSGDVGSARCLASTPLPLAYQNIIYGGLAELILAVDCYAALIARKELTVASACWAILCDTKHSNILVSLRSHALDIEREVLAAVEAQKHLTRVANRTNQSCVGKSSGETTTLTGYPAIAHWHFS
ncbi:unnamed protein product [Phytomonas sp. EM1]|nr:unnamed protein product [Phytomonas sp. EM1]|eukprot:CCW63146.1 unnamed protein product [Phytomonas sp. isolate EM1]